MAGIELLGVGVELIPSTGPDDNLVIGSSVVSGATNGRILFNNSGLLGQYPITGSGSVALIAGALVVASGKTATISNTLTLSGTDGSTLNIGAGGALGSAAFQITGTSGGTIPFLNGNNTWAGTNSFSANMTLTGSAVLKVAGDTTGAGSVLGFGTNSPASTLTGPYTWIKMISSDGSTVYIPAYK